MSVSLVLVCARHEVFVLVLHECYRYESLTYASQQVYYFFSNEGICVNLIMCFLYVCVSFANALALRELTTS